MPTVRKIKQPELPSLPAVPEDLAGWTWQSEPNGGQELNLSNPDRTWSTKWYLKTERAIAEARRWMISQPQRPTTDNGQRTADNGQRTPEDEAPLAWTAVCSSCGQSFIHDRPIGDGEQLQCPSCQPAAAVETQHIASVPDAGGVFRRRAGGPERVMADPRTLVDGRWQPRQQIDEAKLGELAASIKEHGVFEELIAVVNETGLYELITGHRRKLAAIRAGLREVPVKIVEVTTSQARALAIVSNDDREDLTDVERGQAYEQIIADEGISEAELARRLNRPRSYIQQRRALARAAPEIAQALASGVINLSLARGICVGAPDHHLAQVQAIKDIQNRSSWQGPATEKDAQQYAEEAVLSTAKEALQGLGWQVERHHTSSKNLTIVYTDRERPAAWSSAEIMAALRDQRRPVSTDDPPPTAVGTIEKADIGAIKQRGWTIEAVQFQPWALVKNPKLRFLCLNEIPAVVEQARKELEDLKARYKVAGWSLRTRSASNDDFEATTKEGRSEHLWSWTTANQFLKKIETGKEARTPNTTIRSCNQCGESKPVTYQQGRYLCQTCVTALRDEEQRIRAELRAAIVAEAGDWISQAPIGVLQLLATQIASSSRLGIQQSMQRDEKAAVIHAADPAVLHDLLLDIVESIAYVWRDHELGCHTVAGAAIAVGEEPEQQ